MFDTHATDTLPLTRPEEKRHWLTPVWKLLHRAYRNVEGGLHYASREAMLETSWVPRSSSLTVELSNHKQVSTRLGGLLRKQLGQA